MSLSLLARKTNRRKHERHPVNVAISILVTDSEGRESVAHAQLLDISVKGARMRVSQRIPTYSIVSFFHNELAIGGRGTVRYCAFAKNGYVLGLELPNGTGWREPLQPNADLLRLAADALQNKPSGAQLPLSGLESKR
jgi:hypothetical protein